MVASITSKWRVVLPKAVRKHLGVSPGDKLDLVLREDRSVVVFPVTLRVGGLKGIVAHRARTVGTREMDAAIRKRARGKRT